MIELRPRHATKNVAGPRVLNEEREMQRMGQLASVWDGDYNKLFEMRLLTSFRNEAVGCILIRQL